MPAKWSRSKQKKTTGTFWSAAAISRSVFNWARSWSAAKDGLMLASNATSSPSRIMPRASCLPSSAASPGNVAESSSPRRERSFTPCSSTKASTRYPSSLGSHIQSGAIEAGVAGLGEHRGERGGHRLDLARGHELRGRNPVRGDDLEVLDRHSGEDRAVLRGDIHGSREPVLVLDQQPLLPVLGAHQGEGAFQLLAAQEDAQLALSLGRP